MLIGGPVQEMQFPGDVLPTSKYFSHAERIKLYFRFVLGCGFSHL